MSKRLYNMGEYIGKKFGEWTVVKHSHFDKSSEFWTVRCNCGYETTQRVDYVLKGKSNSCKSCAMKKFRTGEEVPCENCGSIIYKSSAQLDRSKSGKHFCSKKCARSYYSDKVQADINSVCETCGKEFHSSLSAPRLHQGQPCSYKRDSQRGRVAI